jgi:hypothetical protein
VERATGVDLEQARVHTGVTVDEAASALGAKAFSVGRDVHVASSHYQPDTAAGDWLLRHELTHVAQQGAADARSGALEVRPADDSFERAADTVASGPRSAGGVQHIAPAVQRLVSQKETKGIALDVTELTNWVGRDYWTQKILGAYFASMPTARFSADAEERDAVLSAVWSTHLALGRLPAATVRVITIPKRGPKTKELAYRLEFTPGPQGPKDPRPSLDIEFIAEGPAAVAATPATPATAPSLPSSWSQVGFPTGGLTAYQKARPEEVSQLLGFVNAAPADKSFKQIVQTSTATPAHATTFLAEGSKDAQGALTSLTVRLVAQRETTPGTVPADYDTHDYADLKIEEQQALTKDALGTLNGLAKVPAGERLAVKFAIWQYFKAGKTRNAEVDAIVPLPDGTTRILYTFRFEPKTNDVSIERIGEEGKGAAVLDPATRAFDVQRVQGFDPAFASDVGKLKTWLGSRYPGMTPSGADAPAMIADANTKLNASAGTDKWFAANYTMPVLDATAGATRLQTVHGLDAAQTANMKPFQASELKLIEWALQMLSDAVLAIVRGISLVRQAVKIGRVQKGRGRAAVVTYPTEPKTSGFALLTGSERTVAIYDNITTNDRALFIGQATAGGDARVAPLSAMAVVHELGHHVGWSGASKSVRDEFNAKFVAARAKLKAAPVTWYAAAEPSTEFFPEAFAIYNADPEWMSTNLPDMFAWFESLAKTGKAP